MWREIAQLHRADQTQHRRSSSSSHVRSWAFWLVFLIPVYGGGGCRDKRSSVACKPSLLGKSSSSETPYLKNKPGSLGITHRHTGTCSPMSTRTYEHPPPTHTLALTTISKLVQASAGVPLLELIGTSGGLEHGSPNSNTRD